MNVEPDPMLPLPGLAEPARPVTDLEKAVRRTLKALADDDLLAERDAARSELALFLARVMEDKLRRGRTSTIGNDARALKDLLDVVVPGQTSLDEAVRQAMERWEVIVGELDAAADAGPEVRDPA